MKTKKNTEDKKSPRGIIFRRCPPSPRDVKYITVTQDTSSSLCSEILDEYLFGRAKTGGLGHVTTKNWNGYYWPRPDGGVKINSFLSWLGQSMKIDNGKPFDKLITIDINHINVIFFLYIFFYYMFWQRVQTKNNTYKNVHIYNFTLKKKTKK